MNDEKRKLNCSEIGDDVLLDYVEGELPADLQAKISVHLQECDYCSTRLADVSLMASALRGNMQLQADVRVPAAADKAVIDTIREVALNQRRTLGMARMLKWLVPAAAVVVVVVIAGFLLTGSSAQRGHGYAPTAENASARRTVAQTEQPRAQEPATQGRSVMAALEFEKERSRIFEEALKQAEESMAELNEQLRALGEDVKAEKEKNATLSEQLKERDREAVTLQKAVDAQNETLTELRAKLADDSKKLAQLTADYAGVVRAVKEQEEEVSGMRSELSLLKSQNDESRAAIVRLEKENAELSDRLVVLGDINGDGKADVSDALLVLERLLSGADVAYTPGADANRDGKVDVGDVLLILNKSLVE